MPLTLIGLTGPIASGKSTVSDYLENTWGFTGYYFAKPLKEIGLAFGFEHEQLYGTQAQKLEINKYWNVSAREFMQQFGTEICRNVLPATIPAMSFGESQSPWVRLFEIFMQKLLVDHPNSCVVISDLRFLNEAEAIKRFGGYIVRVERISEQLFTHVSETEMAQIKPDFTIVNTGTKDELYDKITEIVDILIHIV